MLSTSFYSKHGLLKYSRSYHLKILSITTNTSYKKLASPYTLLTKYNLFKVNKKCKRLLECGDDGYPRYSELRTSELKRKNMKKCKKYMKKKN